MTMDVVGQPRKTMYQVGDYCPHCLGYGQSGQLEKAPSSVVLVCNKCKLNPYTGKVLSSSSSVEKIDRLGETCDVCFGAALIQSIDEPESTLWCVQCDVKAGRYLYKKDGVSIISTPVPSKKAGVWNPNDRAGKNCPSCLTMRLSIDDEDPTVVNCVKCMTFGARYADTSMIKMDADMVAEMLTGIRDAVEETEVGAYEGWMGGQGYRHSSHYSSWAGEDYAKVIDNMSPWEPLRKEPKWLSAADFPELVAA